MSFKGFILPNLKVLRIFTEHDIPEGIIASLICDLHPSLKTITVVFKHREVDASQEEQDALMKRKREIEEAVKRIDEEIKQKTSVFNSELSEMESKFREERVRYGFMKFGENQLPMFQQAIIANRIQHIHSYSMKSEFINRQWYCYSHIQSTYSSTHNYSKNQYSFCPVFDPLTTYEIDPAKEKMNFVIIQANDSQSISLCVDMPFSHLYQILRASAFALGYIEKDSELHINFDKKEMTYSTTLLTADVLSSVYYLMCSCEETEVEFTNIAASRWQTSKELPLSKNLRLIAGSVKMDNVMFRRFE